jgi:ribonucleotide reductase alpha subunit
MERTEVLDMMTGLKLYGMRNAYDETLATAISASTSRSAWSAIC